MLKLDVIGKKRKKKKKKNVYLFLLYWFHVGDEDVSYSSHDKIKKWFQASSCYGGHRANQHHDNLQRASVPELQSQQVSNYYSCRNSPEI